MTIFDTDNLHDSKEVDLYMYTLINNKLPWECLCTLHKNIPGIC